MKVYKEKFLEALNKMKDKGVIDTGHYAFLKSKIEETNDVVVLERLYYVTSYFIDFYEEENYEKK